MSTPQSDADYAGGMSNSKLVPSAGLWIAIGTVAAIVLAVLFVIQVTVGL